MANTTVFFPLESYDYGGVASFVVQYTRILHKNGFNTVILAREGEIEKPNEYFEGSQTLVIPGVLRSNLFFQIMGIFKYYYYLHKMYNNFQVDIIHFSISLPSLFCLLHGSTWRIKRVGTFYGASDLEVRSSLYQISMTAYFGLLLRKGAQYLVLSSCKQIITFSSYSANLLCTHFSKKFEYKTSIIPGYFVSK